MMGSHKVERVDYLRVPEPQPALEQFLPAHQETQKVLTSVFGPTAVDHTKVLGCHPN